MEMIFMPNNEYAALLADKERVLASERQNEDFDAWMEAEGKTIETCTEDELLFWLDKQTAFVSHFAPYFTAREMIRRIVALRESLQSAQEKYLTAVPTVNPWEEV